ncbi:MAG TPA: PP2C family protein-serine/threonine phosphatase [Candidatus Angelobacter sp.]|nr:PP2C family protein-serine/threonine phosphatase [Candidatus Angelobacter sp.]
MRKLFPFKRTRTGPAAPAHAQPPEIREAQLAALYYGRRTGGDCYDFVRVSPTRVLFAVLDVAGKKDQNRGIVAAAQSTLRKTGAELLAEEDTNETDAMIEICLQLNRSIRDAAGRVCPCPVFSGCYNEGLGTVCYFNAGHTPGLLRHETSITELPATGLPLGLFSHCTPDASIVALAPGSALLVVSRGTVEARHKGEEFGLEQVKSSFRHAHAHTAKEICDVVVHQMHEFMHKRPVKNDVTVLSLARPAAAKSMVARG